MTTSTATVKGLIIKETKVGEGNKIFTVLTDEYGKIQASAGGVRSYKSKLSGGCGLFYFSKFELKKGKSMYNIASADRIYSFYDLRTDIDKLSYAAYFCELLNIVTVEQSASAILRLALNTLYYAEKSDDLSLIKAVFELRLMTECGFMPNAFSCGACGAKENLSRFSPSDGTVFCESCGGGIRILSDTIHAMQYIISAEQKKIFSFSVSDDVKRQLCDIAEKYILTEIEKLPKSLTYLRQLCR